MKAGCNLSFRPLLPVAPVQAWAHVSQWLDRFRLCCSVLAPARDTHFHRPSCSLSREHALSAVDGARGRKAIFPIRPGGPRRQGEERTEGRAAVLGASPPAPGPKPPSALLGLQVSRTTTLLTWAAGAEEKGRIKGFKAAGDPFPFYGVTSTFPGPGPSGSSLPSLQP